MVSKVLAKPKIDLPFKWMLSANLIYLLWYNNYDYIFLQIDKEKVASIIAQALKKQEESGDRADGAVSPSNAGGAGLVSQTFSSKFHH